MGMRNICDGLSEVSVTKFVGWLGLPVGMDNVVLSVLLVWAFHYL